MTKTELNNLYKAAISNAQRSEMYLTMSYVQSKAAALEDLITAAYYAGRATMADNIYTTEKPDDMSVTDISQKLLGDCFDSIRYFV